MNELRAILWLDWRLVRRDFTLLIALAVLGPPVLVLFAPRGGVIAVLAYAQLPCSAALLGATLSAEEGGLAFLHARAASWARTVGLRLLHRCLLSTAIALGALLSMAAFTSEAAILVDSLGSGLLAALVLVLTVVGGTSAAALAGVRCRQAFSALFLGYLLQLIAVFAAFLVFGWLAEAWTGRDGSASPALFASVPIVVGALLAVAAFLALRAQPLARRLSWRRFAAGGLAALALFAAAAVLPPLLLARSAMQRMNAAWEDAGLAPSARPVWPPPQLDQQREAARVLESAGLWPEWERRSTGHHARLRALSARLHESLEAAGGQDLRRLGSAELEELLGPEEELLRRWSSLASREDLRPEERLGLSRQSWGLRGLLLAHAERMRRSGEGAEAERAVTAAWRVVMPVSPLPKGPNWHVHARGLERAEAVMGAIRRGLPASPELRHELANMDLAPRTRVLASWSSSSWTRPIAWLFSPRLARIEAEGNARLAEWLGRLGRERPCGRVVPPPGVPARHGARHAGEWRRAVELELEGALTARVLDRRAGRPIEPESRCPGARWRLDEAGDGSWSIALVGGPWALRHDEPGPS